MNNRMQLASDFYDDSSIKSANIFMVQSIVGNELQYDTLDATLNMDRLYPTRFRPRGRDGMLTFDDKLLGVLPIIHVTISDISKYKYGAVVLYWHNENLIGKFYMNKIIRSGKTLYDVECISAIGLLSNSQHYGGIYQGVTAADLIADVIGGQIPYTLSPDYKKVLLYGWLPVATRRDNLHQILFSLGSGVLKDVNGDPVFAPLLTKTHTLIPKDRIYLSGKVEYPEITTEVSVSEHTYNKNKTDETTTLLEGAVISDDIITPKGQSVKGSLIIFDGPMHDLQATGTAIIESTVNYAVLAPSPDCKLTGQKYTHIVRQTTRFSSRERALTSQDNKISITDATLVSFANSEAVADRVMSYYNSARKVKSDIVVDKEAPGLSVEFMDPFEEKSTGIIASMDMNLSHILKAQTEIITDYTPPDPGNTYKTVVVVPQSGAWVVPSNVNRIRVVLIGGGSGGHPGETGEAGMRASVPKYVRGKGGKGGKGGEGGEGGNIYIATLNVTAGDSIPVTIGKGGKPNAIGNDTLFGDISSANGSRSISGYTDLIESITYASQGEIGTDGGEGGGGEPSDHPGENVVFNGITYRGGSTGKDWYGSGDSPYVRKWGGCGGGAAVGSNGENGRPGDQGGHIYDFNSRGGKGGNATLPGTDGTFYGNGGNGGHGGGGGGGGGAMAVDSSPFVADGGPGGLGSQGGNGANGCVIIYY